MSEFTKGLQPLNDALDGSSLRVLIVHTRWNSRIVDALVKGTYDTLTAKHHVKPENIAVRSVPGAYELPSAAQRLIGQAQQQSNNLIANVTDTMADIMGDMVDSSDKSAQKTAAGSSDSITPMGKQGPFDAVICIGVLIKGSTQHFEYIADAVSHGLMRVGLDQNVPVVFGVLTCLTDDQALERAGLGDSDTRHNHGEDWGSAAVEMALLKL
ncbi:lumazine synthase [Dimargaris verticillata]|uniref:6,7-dimethyl-8-ribityllumazine synthase n=1 Tax=Dimargaris verticillata TaxID=2761393 RepID=A0A9W8ED87_9FUNG|nr:lumazine synthase [Dimargaris verticillata]